MPVFFGYRSAVAAGRLLASSALPSLPADNLATPHGDPASSWQTAPGIMIATIRIDGGAGAIWRLLWLAQSNLTSAALIQWTISDQPDLSSPIYASGSLSGVALRQHVHVTPQPVTGRYCQLRILNASNPEGHLRVGQLFAGPAYQSGRGLSYQSTYGREAAQDRDETRGGQLYVTQRFQRRGWELALGPIAEQEAWSVLDDLMMVAGAGGNVGFVPASTSPHINRQAVLGLLEPGRLGFFNGTGRFRNWSARLMERL